MASTTTATVTNPAPAMAALMAASLDVLYGTRSPGLAACAALRAA